MNKIMFRISKNSLIVGLFDKDIKNNLNNTNIIDTKEIYFTSTYIEQNMELVSSFLNVIIIKQNVDKIVIHDEEISLLCLKIAKTIPSLTSIYIKPDIIMNYEEFLCILENKYVKELNVYDIPPYLLERLDTNKGLVVQTRSEILFVSSFMNVNDISTYADIFYKKSIIVNTFEGNDYNDFNTFININKYLKMIIFNNYNKNMFSIILSKIIKLSIKNIKISFNEENIDLNLLYKDIQEFKSKYQDKLDELNITFKINYSEKYKKDNIFKQLRLNFIKYTLLMVILVVASMLGINVYRNYVDNEKYTEIEADLDKLLLSAEEEAKQSENEFIYIEPDEGDEDIIHRTYTTTISTYDIKYDKIFDKLLEVNKDTVGWLTVNNTNIDYPVVQGTDNDYYLKRDFYKNSNRRGWVFADFRVDFDDLSDNIIIYGHNLANQKMFGTLKNVLNENWYKKSSNQIITFNTLTTSMRWQIFSIYKVPVTTDYLITDFNSKKTKQAYLDMITKRNTIDFGVNVSVKDKILTLSTCSEGHTNRLVVHAKLIKE